MDDRPTAVLRVEPHTIPRLRVAYEQTALQIGDLITQVQQEAHIREPWMGDPISEAIRNLYNIRFAGNTPGSPLHVLIQYREELLKVVDALTTMEDRYRRTEGDNAELWGRL